MSIKLYTKVYAIFVKTGGLNFKVICLNYQGIPVLTSLVRKSKCTAYYRSLYPQFH